MMPTPPLGLRNRLAETILSALGDADARRELYNVAVSDDVDWVRDAPPEHAALVRARARRASEALAACPLLTVKPRNEGRPGFAGASRASGVWGPGSAPMVVDRAMAGPSILSDALAGAAALFDAGLHFEVHEVLEPHWVRAQGAERRALQGLIQIAVGFQHLANGNLAGARALLAEGSLRLRDGRLTGLDLDRFAGAVSEITTCLGEPVTVPPFPRIT